MRNLPIALFSFLMLAVVPEHRSRDLHGDYWGPG